MSRALCDLFNSAELTNKIALRGGTAIHKILLARPLRYSEDIDLVQTQPIPIGGTIDAIRTALSWLSDCKRKQTSHSTHLIFNFSPENSPNEQLSLKIEINTREHKNSYGIKRFPFCMDNDWHSAKTDIVSFHADELFATKLRSSAAKKKKP